MYRVQSDKHLVCFAGGDSSKISFGAESEMLDLVAKFEVWTAVNHTSGIIPLIVSKHSGTCDSMERMFKTGVGSEHIPLRNTL
jgi:hypothetical protein